MENYLLTNQCTRVRVKTSDDHSLKVFSVFYQHPGMLDPDGWKLLDNGEKILVDENTMWLLDKHECEFGYKPKEGTILTCKITPVDVEPSELKAHWEDMLQFCMEVKRDFAKFVDSQKVDNITDELENLKVKSCSPQESKDPLSIGRTLESIPEEITPIPPSE